MMAETYMLQALQNGFASIQKAPAQLDDILIALNANELKAAKDWFGNVNNKIVIAPGFPMAPEQLPFIGVTVANESQILEQTGIGLNYYETIDTTAGTAKEARGARFSGTLKATVYTPNADLVIWISAICKWALLSQYDWLGGDTVGFNNLQISVGDFEPSPGFLPIFTFARGVILSAEYDLVFTTTGSLIKSTETTGNFTT